MSIKVAVAETRQKPATNVDYDATLNSLHRTLIDHAIAVREAEEAKRQFTREAVQWLVDRGMHECLKIDLGMLGRIARSQG